MGKYSDDKVLMRGITLLVWRLGVGCFLAGTVFGLCLYHVFQ